MEFAEGGLRCAGRHHGDLMACRAHLIRPTLAVDMPGQQSLLAFEQGDGEEIRAAGNSGANIVRHGRCQRMFDV